MTDKETPKIEDLPRDNKRNSFVFYRSFYEAIKSMPEGKEQLELYNAIFEYSLNFKQEIKLSKSVESYFILIKPQLEANRIKWINGQKGAKHGKKGGRPKI